MSEDEKALQIGRLKQGLREAKENLAHIQVKIRTVSSVYTEVGTLLSFQMMDAMPNFTIEGGHLRIPHSFVNREIADGLLNEGQLIEVLGDYMAASKRVSSLESQLAALE